MNRGQDIEGRYVDIGVCAGSGALKAESRRSARGFMPREGSWARRVCGNPRTSHYRSDLDLPPCSPGYN